jgi:hypothetical protein
MSCKPEPDCVNAGGVFVLMSRVVDKASTILTQADTESVRVEVYLIDGDTRTAIDQAGAAITDGSAFASPAVSDVIFDGLQTDSRWSIDGTGYNFAFAMELPIIDQLYEVRVTIATTAGDDVVIVYRLNAI